MPKADARLRFFFPLVITVLLGTVCGLAPVARGETPAPETAPTTAADPASTEDPTVFSTEKPSDPAAAPTAAAPTPSTPDAANPVAPTPTPVPNPEKTAAEKVPFAPAPAPIPPPEAPPASNAVVHDGDIPGLTLVDANDQPSGSFGLPMDPKKPFEVLFRATIPKAQENYRSWVIEIADAAGGQSYQIRVEGKVQNPIRWDGFFAPQDHLKAGHQYRTKLTLMFADGKSVESLPATFATLVRFEDLNRSTQNNVLSAYLIPSGAMYYMVLNAVGGIQSVHFPVLMGEITAALFDRHRVSLRIETSSHLIMDVEPSSLGAYYSDISFFYSFRWLGKNPQHLVRSWRPKYAGKDPKALEGLPPLYTVESVKRYNVDAGVRGFITVLRGSGGELIDSVTARSLMGAALTVSGDYTWRRWVAKAGAEVGYSFLQGSIFEWAANASISFDGLEFVSPGLQVRYQSLTGSSAGDPFDGVTNGGPVAKVSNTVFLTGLLLTFKL